MTELILILERWDYDSDMNYIFLEHQVRERQQALLSEARNQQLLKLENPGFRARLAHLLRDIANKLEPIRRDAINASREEFVASK